MLNERKTILLLLTPFCFLRENIVYTQIQSARRMKYWIVDVFSGKPFLGSPACVFVSKDPLDSKTCERLSLEVHQAETAFVSASIDDNGHFGIRFFSPGVEIKKPSHSLLAAAHVLWTELGDSLAKPLYFESLGNVYKIIEQDEVMYITLNRSQISPASIPDRLSKALGTLPVSVFECEGGLIVELHSEDELRSLEPDFAKLSTIEVDRIIVTCEGKDYDYVVRVFAPRLGENEASPSLVTQGDLASYWHEQNGKTTLWSTHAGLRSGKIRIELGEDTFTISGKAVTVANGEFKALP